MSATPDRIRIRREGEQPADPLRVLHRDVEADDRAVAPADDRRLFDLEMVEQGDHVRGHQIVAIRLLIAAAAAVAAAVHDDDLIMPLQRADLVAPVIGIGEAAMQQHDRLAAAERCVPDLDAVDGREAALRCLGQGRRRRQVQPSRRRMCCVDRDRDEERGEKIAKHHDALPADDVEATCALACSPDGAQRNPGSIRAVGKSRIALRFTGLQEASMILPLEERTAGSRTGYRGGAKMPLVGHDFEGTFAQSGRRQGSCNGGSVPQDRRRGV